MKLDFSICWHDCHPPETQNIILNILIFTFKSPGKTHVKECRNPLNDENKNEDCSFLK